MIFCLDIFADKVWCMLTVEVILKGFFEELFERFEDFFWSINSLEENI